METVVIVVEVLIKTIAVILGVVAIMCSLSWFYSSVETIKKKLSKIEQSIEIIKG